VEKTEHRPPSSLDRSPALTEEQLKEAIPADDNHKHFGGGQTETW